MAGGANIVAAVNFVQRLDLNLMLKGLTHIVGSIVRQTVSNPTRLRYYGNQSESFIHRTRAGLMFELYPNEYVDRFIAVEGIYERRFLAYLHSILKPEAVMLDIGANIGNHSIYLASKCREIHCFEPNPHVADRLRRNIALNNLTSKLQVHQLGLGGKDEMLPFVEIDGNLGASHFVTDVAAGQKVKHLEVREAERAITGLGLDRIDYVKVDVEGMEEAVLTALKPVFERYRPIVSFEHHETKVAEGTFARIRHAFVDYKLVHPFFAPEGNAAQKVLWNLRHDGGPVLAEINQPERRSYNNILAMPL